MVKLIFNPKNETNFVVAKSLSSKKIEINFNPFSKINENKIEETISSTSSSIGGTFQRYGEPITCTNLIGLNNCHFVLQQWFNQSNKSFLMIGPTGCGKTKLVNLFCTENNIKLLNIKLNDNKTKRDLLKDIEVFIEYNQIFLKNNQKKLLLIDEYQNGLNDIFSITDIISINEKYVKFIKVLVISSDSKGTKLNDLKKVSETYYINEIPKGLIKNWIVSLKTDLTEKQIEYLTENCGSDKRLILNILELNNNVNFNLDNFLKDYYKDNDKNIFEYIKKLFDQTENVNLNEIFKVYDNEGFLLANLVHENYLDYNQDIHSIALAADAVSYGEILFSDTYESSKSFLPDLHCLNSIIIPSYYSKSQTNFKGTVRSSVINNRYNILLNNKKIISKINENLYKNVLDIYDIYTIKKVLNQELIKSKTVLPLKIEFIKNVLKNLNGQIDRLELIYKHFNEFKEITGKEIKTKNFTLKFKEKLI